MERGTVWVGARVRCAWVGQLAPIRGCATPRHAGPKLRRRAKAHASQTESLYPGPEVCSCASRSAHGRKSVERGCKSVDSESIGFIFYGFI